MIHACAATMELLSHLVAPAVAGRVDKPSDVIHPDSTQCSTPHQSRQASNSEQRSKHRHHMPRIRLLDKLVERLQLQIPSVAPVPYSLQRCL